MTDTEEAERDAQFADESDRIFYARGFPLADFEEDGDDERSS